MSLKVNVSSSQVSGKLGIEVAEAAPNLFGHTVVAMGQGDQLPQGAGTMQMMQQMAQYIQSMQLRQQKAQTELRLALAETQGKLVGMHEVVIQAKDLSAQANAKADAMEAANKELKEQNALLHEENGAVAQQVHVLKKRVEVEQRGAQAALVLADRARDQAVEAEVVRRAVVQANLIFRRQNRALARDVRLERRRANQEIRARLGEELSYFKGELVRLIKEKSQVATSNAETSIGAGLGAGVVAGPLAGFGVYAGSLLINMATDTSVLSQFEEVIASVGKKVDGLEAQLGEIRD